MMIQGQFRAQRGYLFFMLVIMAALAAGCGGGGDSSSPSNGNPSSTQSADLVAGPVPIVAVFTGETAVLDGSHSHTATGAPSTYQWSFTSRPEGSTAVLQSTNAATTSFKTDVTGTYTVQLEVTDNGAVQRDVATVIAADSNPSGVPSTGVWKHQGLSSFCVNCHNGTQIGGDGTITTPKSGNHLSTSNKCQACHTPLGFKVALTFDHKEIFNNCSECHNGVLAIGKSEFHTPTTAECNSSGCHDTTKFVVLPQNNDGSYDHTGIDTPCLACHNGIVAKGKIVTHIATDKDCGFCHTTKYPTFAGGYPDHSTLTQPCTDCHSGNNANITGPTVGHPVMPNGVQCNLCHSTTSFSMGGVFDHGRADPAVVPCQTCHTDNNSINARGKGSAPTPHVATTLDCGICHNTTSFATAIFDHSTIVAGTRCDSCHNGTDAKGMPTNGTHLTPINGDDCDVCHTSPGGTFTTGIFVHSTAYLTAYQCMDCHNDVIAGGKTVDHIPTTDDCGVCHTTAIDTNTGLGVSFKGATVDHSGLTSGCAVCHNGATAIDQPATHVPTPNGVDCSVCHSTGGTVTPAPFAPANNFAHQASTITAGCTSCHNGKYKLADNTVVKTKPSGTHIPAIDDCGVCHDSTTIPDGFKSAALFVNNVHPPITKGCGGCHTGQFPPALGKSDTPAAHTPHVPTSQDCNLCHNNVDFSVSLFQHTGISNKCSTCHDGTYATSANALGKPANHVVTSADCGACHNIKADFTGGYVDHTGPQVTGAGILCESCHDGNTPGVLGKKDAVPTHEVTSLDCIACHSPGGSFATAVFDHSTLTADTRCDSCHGVTSIGKDAKTNPPHVTTDLDCRVCHNTDSFASAQYDHTTIDSDCGVCHDGVSATGKITNHVPTNLDCAICHVTAGFKPATFSHAPNQINSTCSSCHDGVFATGKTTNHIATSATSDCGDCHSTDTFLGATYDHTGVVSGCAASGCHDGNSTGVKGMPTGHLVTTLDCHYCHTAGGSFVTLVWDHRNNTSECKSCHDKTGSGYINSVYNIAPLKPSGHFVTTAECIECHTTSAWLPNANFKHSATSNYPGDHSTRRVSTCDQCHTSNNQNITYPYSTYAPDCAACHANRYKSGDHGGRSVSTNANCGKSGCHRVSSSSF